MALIALLAACGGSTSDELYTYHRDAAPIVAARCVGCHQEGEVAPFPLTTYAEVQAVAGPMRTAISSGTMPPFLPAEGCNEYAEDISLTEQEEQTLLAWLDAGAPEGDPAEAPPPAADTVTSFVPDVTLTLPEPYTPATEPDDYRCQIVEWPLAETAYITGFQVIPDQRAIVHHTIAYGASAASAQKYRDLDAAEPGPGYTCFGGPTGASAAENPDDLSLEEILADLEDQGGVTGARWLGAWVPGAASPLSPPGTGVRMEPGDIVIVQMHYNTSSSSPTADQSSIEISTAPSVEREAVVMPFTDLGWVTGLDLFGGPMTIPAGEADVLHETVAEGDGLIASVFRAELGLPSDQPLIVHSAGHHMHQLGTSGRQEIRHADGTTTCLVDIPRWDFSWQGSYTFLEPVVFAPDDEMVLRCTWDNSAENQPIFDGTVQEPQDVQWGEGTSDEMCLSTLYVTAP